MKSYSIIRGEEYEHLSGLTLDGKILDAGGSKRSGYHQLIKGDHQFTVINIDPACEPDQFVDIEKRFPFEDESFDHTLSLNVLEHLFEFENAFSEQLRCIKKGGKFVVAAPFMHFIHGSPDDYLRYTASSYQKLGAKFGADIEKIAPLGQGLFSLIFQLVGGAIPSNFLRQLFKKIALGLDGILRMSKKYRKLCERIPLGYFVVFVKK